MRYHHDGRKRHWLHLGKGWVLQLEFGKLSWAWAHVEWGEQYVEGVKMTFGLRWGVWFGLEVPWGVRRRFGRYWPQNTREVGIQYNDGRLRLDLFTSPWGDHRFKHRWYSAFWNHNELTLFNTKWIVGRDRYEVAVTSDPQLVMAHLDGREYPLRVTRQRRTWRNRVRTITSEAWEIEVPDGAPVAQFAGKGENSWDCDEDAIYGMFAPYPKYERPSDAAWAYVEAVIRNRRRYGMPSLLQRRVREEAPG